MRQKHTIPVKAGILFAIAAAVLVGGCGMTPFAEIESRGINSINLKQEEKQ